MNPKHLILAETKESLAEKLQASGFPAFRTKQVLDWLYKFHVSGFDQMTNLPKDFRAWLEEHFSFGKEELIKVTGSNDTTQKLLLRLDDGSLVETVILRAPVQNEETGFGRVTICVSSQVGCAYGCKFCASGLGGLKRNLDAGEIITQLMHVCHFIKSQSSETVASKESKVPFDNIVFMGMGEPLANYENVIRAITIINADWGFFFGARRITISTSGLVPQIEKLADEPISFRLAVSLHGAKNEVRDQIMPVNRRFPLEKLLPAIRMFGQKRKRMITLEYILIENVNDGLDQAKELAKIANDCHAHVNLIPYNTVQGLPWKRPNSMRQNAFLKILEDAKVSVTIRREKGHDIAAACGQLRLQEMKKTS